MPWGVQGSGAVSPSTRRPRFIGCRPSTSLAGSTSSSTRYSSRPLGSGNWTRKPVHAGSALSSATTASISAWVALAGSSRWTLAIPICAQSLCLAETYQRLPGSSPTSTVPRPGTMPRSRSALTRSASSSLIVARVALPSRIVAVTATILPGRSARDLDRPGRRVPELSYRSGGGGGGNSRCRRSVIGGAVEPGRREALPTSGGGARCRSPADCTETLRRGVEAPRRDAGPPRAHCGCGRLCCQTRARRRRSARPRRGTAGTDPICGSCSSLSPRALSSLDALLQRCSR